MRQRSSAVKRIPQRTEFLRDSNKTYPEPCDLFARGILFSQQGAVGRSDRTRRLAHCANKAIIRTPRWCPLLLLRPAKHHRCRL